MLRMYITIITAITKKTTEIVYLKCQQENELNVCVMSFLGFLCLYKMLFLFMKNSLSPVFEIFSLLLFSLLFGLYFADITLPTKFCLVKDMIFPVVMYGCKS